MRTHRRSPQRSPASFSRHWRRNLLDTGATQRAHEIRDESGKLDQVLGTTAGATGRHDHEVIKVRSVGQSAVDRPQPTVLAPEEEPVLTPVAVREGEDVLLTVAGVKRMDDPKALVAFLETRCS